MANLVSILATNVTVIFGRRLGRLLSIRASKASMVLRGRGSLVIVVAIVLMIGILVYVCFNRSHEVSPNPPMVEPEKWKAAPSESVSGAACFPKGQVRKVSYVSPKRLTWLRQQFDTLQTVSFDSGLMAIQLPCMGIPYSSWFFKVCTVSNVLTSFS
jgi:hypothetical protein